jgi:hypothetical protein
VATGDDDLNALFGSLGIDPKTLGTAKDAKSSEDNPLVYMPGNGTNLVKQYNDLAQQASDLEYSIQRASKGGSFSGASMGAYQSQLMKIQAKMKTVQAKMKSGEGKGYDALDYETARLLPTGWSPDRLKEFVNKGIMYGLPGFDVGMGMPEIVSAWDDLVKASATFSTGGKKWTPWDVMDTYGGKDQKFGTMTKGDWVYDVATGERLKYVGKTTRTSKSEQVNLSSPEEAQALITQVLREALGRAPNAEELAKFKASIAGYEKSSPEVTTVTETATPESIAAAQASGGDVFTGANQKSTTSGGVSDAARAALVTAPTEDTKEYGKYQSATTYWDAMMQMIGGG